MRFENIETPSFSGSAGTSGSGGTNPQPAVAESMTLYDRNGTAVAIFAKSVAGVVTVTLGSLVIPATPPEVPAAPDAQDVVDALVALGLVTQAEE